jgi:hypothetical protein
VGDGLVWYVSYGANMDARRLGCYISGGTPPGGSRANPGCRDGAPPRRTRAVWLPGAVYFALESPMWGGGLALYDPDDRGGVEGGDGDDGRAAARAYLVTSGQFADIAAQEMYRSPGTDVDLGALVRDGRLRLGAGRYETLVHAGDLDGVPLVTFTAPWRCADVPAAAPSAAYLRTLGGGLMAAHGWPVGRAAAYLAGLRGSARDADDMAGLLRTA